MRSLGRAVRADWPAVALWLRRPGVAAVVSLSLAAGLVAAIRLSGPYAAFSVLDDGMTLEVAARVSEGDLSSLTTRSGGRFLPAYWLYQVVVAGLAGGSPGVFHLCNTLTCAVAVLAVCWLVGAATRNRYAGVPAAWLVAGSSSFGENLVTLGKSEPRVVAAAGLALVFGWCAWRSCRSRTRAIWLVCLALAVIGSAGAKEPAVAASGVLPCAAVLFWWWHRRAENARSGRRSGLVVGATSLAAGGAYIVWRSLAPGTAGSYTEFVPSWANAWSNARYYFTAGSDTLILLGFASVWFVVAATRRRARNEGLCVAAGCLIAAALYLAFLLYWRGQQRYYLLVPAVLGAIAWGLSAWSARPAGDRSGRWWVFSAIASWGLVVAIGLPSTVSQVQVQSLHDHGWHRAFRRTRHHEGVRLVLESEPWFAEQVFGAGILMRRVHARPELSVVGAGDLIDPSLVTPELLNLYGAGGAHAMDPGRVPQLHDLLLTQREIPPRVPLRGVGLSTLSTDSRFVALGARVRVLETWQDQLHYRDRLFGRPRRFEAAWTLHRVTRTPFVFVRRGGWRADGWVGAELVLQVARDSDVALVVEAAGHPTRGAELRLHLDGRPVGDVRRLDPGGVLRLRVGGASGLVAGNRISVRASADVPADDPDPLIRWRLLGVESADR